MNNKITIHRMKSHTPEWHEFRSNGIGGSEIGPIVGQNRWKPAVKLFHEKAGLVPTLDWTNEKMFHGRNMEDYIANLARYWDGTKEGMIKNYEAKIIIKDHRRVNGYAVNSDYPHLFASVDRLINKNHINLLTGEMNPDHAILECKQLGYNASKQWESGIPTSYIFQVNQYALIYDVKYIELAILMDGNDFNVYPLERSDNLCQQIVIQSQLFWDKVLEARRLLALVRQNKLSEQEFDIAISEIEPPAEDTEAYREYMSERYKREVAEYYADDAEIVDAQNYEVFSQMIKTLEAYRDQLKGNIIKKIVAEKVEKIVMPDNGYIRYIKREGGKNYFPDFRLAKETKKKLAQVAEDKLKILLGK